MTDLLGDMKRTHSCIELNDTNIDQEVVLMGWVQHRRDHGGVIFVDLRDREGITQVVFDPSVSEAVHQKAQEIRSEYVLGVKGKVSGRPDDMVNPKMATGAIEILVEELRIFSKAKTPPFQIEDRVDASELIRLQYRYLDLRRTQLKNNILARHKTTMTVRNYLDDNGFVDIETPFLTKSTPEGARDYLVPSRVNQGRFLCPAPVSPAFQTAFDDLRF